MRHEIAIAEKKSNDNNEEWFEFWISWWGCYCNNLISPIKVKIFFQIKLNYLNWKKGYKPNT